MITRVLVALVIAFLFRSVPAFSEGEHPEHPQQQQTTLPPEQMKLTPNKAEERKITMAQISTGIKKHLTAETTKASDKKFHTKHGGKELALDLVKVHEERLSGLGGGKYFACVDMKAADGTVYDIDFFLTGKPGQMKVTETSVHKIDGKPLYNWKEENGTWQKTPAS